MAEKMASTTDSVYRASVVLLWNSTDTSWLNWHDMEHQRNIMIIGYCNVHLSTAKIKVTGGHHRAMYRFKYVNQSWEWDPSLNCCSNDCFDQQWRNWHESNCSKPVIRWTYLAINPMLKGVGWWYFAWTILPTVLMCWCQYFQRCRKCSNPRKRGNWKWKVGAGYNGRSEITLVCQKTLSFIPKSSYFLHIKVHNEICRNVRVTGMSKMKFSV